MSAPVMETNNSEGLPPLDPTPAGESPIDHIQWVPSDTLDPNAWNPNRVHKPELRLLERSLLKTGWVQPLLGSADAALHEETAGRWHDG